MIFRMLCPSWVLTIVCRTEGLALDLRLVVRLEWLFDPKCNRWERELPAGSIRPGWFWERGLTKISPPSPRAKGLGLSNQARTVLGEARQR
jgi:hypothetical protein